MRLMISSLPTSPRFLSKRNLVDTIPAYCLDRTGKAEGEEDGGGGIDEGGTRDGENAQRNGIEHRT